MALMVEYCINRCWWLIFSITILLFVFLKAVYPTSITQRGKVLISNHRTKLAANPHSQNLIYVEESVNTCCCHRHCRLHIHTYNNKIDTAAANFSELGTFLLSTVVNFQASADSFASIKWKFIAGKECTLQNIRS